MRTYKKYSVFTLAIIFVASVITALSLIFGATVASAERSISLTGSTYFVTSNNASIANYEVTTSSSSDSSDSESSDDSSTNYVSFLFEDEDDAITYRKNLAFHWYSSASSSTSSDDDDDDDSSSSSGEQSGTEGYLSTTIGFPTISEGDNAGKLPFETFTIKFQSQQYSATEDGVTTNYIRFIAADSSTSTNSGDSSSSCAGVYVVIGDEDVADYTLDDIKNVNSEGTSTSCNLLTNLNSITISFVSYSRGTYTVVVTDGTYVNVVDSSTEESTYSTSTCEQTKKLSDGTTCIKTDGSTIVEGTFTNVGGSYAKYVSSSSGTSVIPLTYSATFPEYNDPSSSSDTYAAQMVLYSFNGQSFESTTSGSSTPAVSDNTSPVVCLDEVVTTLRYGHAIDIGYTVIDMLATSPKSTLYYYVLSSEMVSAGSSSTSTSSATTSCSTCTSSGTCTASTCTTCTATTAASSSTSGTTYNYGYNSTDGLNSAFVEVTSSTTANVIRESGSYTGDYSYACGCKDTTGDAYAYVKIYIYVADSSSTTAGYANTDYVSIDWYIDSDSLAYINDTPFIKAVNDTEGATYVYNASDNTAAEEEEKEEEEEESTTNYTDIVSQIVTGYNAAVEAAIAEQGASAGDGNYLYLPSFEDYVSDNYTDYTSLTFSIYYLAGDDYGSSTSLSYNELTIELDNEGDYKFIIYVTDSSGNKMWYLNETTSSGNGGSSYSSSDSTSGTIVYISTSDLEELLEDPDNSKLKGYVPVFSFHVDYEGLSIETPTAQDIAFVGSEYTASSFDITGLSSNYEATYSLYVFDLASFVDEVLGGETISYSDFIDMVDRLFNNSAYFEYEGEILSYDEITEVLKTVTNNDSTSSSNGSSTNNYTSTEIEELLEQVADNNYKGTLNISRVTTSIYFRTIKSINDIEETDADYDDYVDYAWDYSDSDSLTFVPQDDNTFYVIAVTATDNVYATDSVSAYMCISVSAAAKTLKGESNWLKNNVASVVLLCIAGAALVGIVLLLVIKPREKGDIDLIDENNEKQKTKGRFRFSRKAD